MNSQSRLPIDHYGSIHFPDTRKRTHLVACHYCGEPVHHLIITEERLAYILEERGYARHFFFHLLKQARPDLGGLHYGEFDYAVLLGADD